MRRRELLLGLAGMSLAAAGCARTQGPSTTIEGGADVQRISYGDNRNQFGELTLPSGKGPFPVVVVIHGGFWKSTYDLDLGRPLAADLVKHGVAAWNIEYRRVGWGSGGGGGWPATGDDVAAAVDKLRTIDAPLDLDRVVAVGHSAGGHLAAWLGTREDPAVALKGVVSQAGVLDLVAAHRERLGAGAARALLGDTPEAIPQMYAAASPIAHLPLTVPVTCVHGTADDIVPLSQSQDFVAAAQRAGGAKATLQAIDGADHFAVIDVEHPAWATCRQAALDLLG